MKNAIQFLPIKGLPMIAPGDDLGKLICEVLANEGEQPQDGDILAVAQKIVSKSEGRLINLAAIEPSPRAMEIAPIVAKDPRHVEVILRESREVIWVSPGIFVVETLQGYVCANAGVDRSNIAQPEGNPEDEWVCLLPVDSNASAARLRSRIKALTGAEVAVVINDTHGRPFRMGGVGVALGLAGFEGLADQRGQSDLFGYRLQATQTAVGDELASAASLIMGQASEATPAVLIRGLTYHTPEPDPGATSLVRPKDKDVFRYPPGSERWRNQG
ncbi:MAG TPA: coenzyme F420-0:L-glutamate ligase [Chloroflexia bacterium]|nr:coenzyme F420-0:L-glutamate ligase [Chloroflexia bacterium]